MVLDTVFFDRLVRTMETNHNIVRSNMDSLKITEAWVAFGDQLMTQCKEMLYASKLSEEHDAVFNQMSEIMESEFDEEMFQLSLEKTMEKLNRFDQEILDRENALDLEQD